MNEEWKKIPIEEYSNYEVSNKGRVRLLPRDIEIKDGNSITIKHIEGRDVSVYRDKNVMISRIRGTNDVLKKFSVPLLMLKVFKSDECPGSIDNYVAGYIDGDCTNIDLSNLKWVNRSKNISNHTSKYKNIIIKVDDEIVGYARNTSACRDLFNGYGFKTAASSVGRSIDMNKIFFYAFKLVCVSDDEYEEISKNYEQQDLKILQRKVIDERAKEKRVIFNAEQRRKRAEKAGLKVPKEIPVRLRKEKKPKPKVEKPIKQEVVKNTLPPKPKVKVPKAKRSNDWLDEIDDSLFFEEQEHKREEFKARLAKALREVNNE